MTIPAVGHWYAPGRGGYRMILSQETGRPPDTDIFDGEMGVGLSGDAQAGWMTAAASHGLSQSRFAARPEDIGELQTGF